MAVVVWAVVTGGGNMPVGPWEALKHRHQHPHQQEKEEEGFPCRESATMKGIGFETPGEGAPCTKGEDGGEGTEAAAVAAVVHVRVRWAWTRARRQRDDAGKCCEGGDDDGEGEGECWRRGLLDGRQCLGWSGPPRRP